MVVRSDYSIFAQICECVRRMTIVTSKPSTAIVFSRTFRPNTEHLPPYPKGPAPHRPRETSVLYTV